MRVTRRGVLIRSGTGIYSPSNEKWTQPGLSCAQVVPWHASHRQQQKHDVLMEHPEHVYLVIPFYVQ